MLSKRRRSDPGKRKSDARKTTTSTNGDSSPRSNTRAGDQNDDQATSTHRVPENTTGATASRPTSVDNTNTSGRDPTKKDRVNERPTIVSAASSTLLSSRSPVSRSTDVARPGIRSVEGVKSSHIWGVEQELREARTTVLRTIFDNPGQPLPDPYRRPKEEAIVPKSAALRPVAFYMAYTGKTQDLEYLKTMAGVARDHGFEVRVVAAGEYGAELLAKDELLALPIKIIGVDEAGKDLWTEDTGSFGGKTVSFALPSLLPSEAQALAGHEEGVKQLTDQIWALFRDKSRSWDDREREIDQLKAQRSILEAKSKEFTTKKEDIFRQTGLHILHERYERFTGGKQPLLATKSDYHGQKIAYKDTTIAPLDFGSVGQVATNGWGRSKIAIGTTEKLNLRADICHLEGGNVLTGILPSGQRYALVGRDSVSQSRFLLAREGLALLGQANPSDAEIRTFIDKNLDDERMRDLVAADLGLDPKQVHFIEQPADFHLDLSMGILTNDRIILDDPKAAADILVGEAQRIIGSPPDLQRLVDAQREFLRAETKKLLADTVTDEIDRKFATEDVDTVFSAPDLDKALGEIRLAIAVSENTKVKEAFTKLREKLPTLPDQGKMIVTLRAAIAQTRREEALKSYHIDKIASYLADHIPGVAVVRGPLAFDGDLTEGTARILPRMNFANFEAGTGTSGQFLILNGGTKEIEERTRAWFETKVGFKGDIRFVDQSASEASLGNSGGMGCRAKGFGTS
jgi:cell division septum initiation protein DivIVA